GLSIGMSSSTAALVARERISVCSVPAVTARHAVTPVRGVSRHITLFGFQVVNTMRSGQKVIPMSFENSERCLENLECLLGIQSRSAVGLDPRDQGLLSRHYPFPFGNVACCSSERTFVRLHSCEYITRHACFSAAFPTVRHLDCCERGSRSKPASHLVAEPT